MKKVMVAIWALLGLLGSQAAQAWDWPFFAKKQEPTIEASQVPSLSEPKKKDSPPLDGLAKEFLSEDRLKLVARSYAQSYNFHGSQSPFPIALTDNLLATQGQSVGLSFQASDQARVYAEYSGINQSLKSPWLADFNSVNALAFGFSVGADLDYPGFRAGIRYFDFDYSRLRQNLAPLDQFLNQTTTDNRLQGLEFTADLSLEQVFDWNFELRPYFTLTRFFDQWSNRAENGPLASDLSLSYGLAFNHEITGLSMSLEANGPGRRAPYYFPFMSQDFSSATVYDFHLVKRLYDWQDKGSLFLKADITNIADTPSDNKRANNEEGRTFKTGLRFEY
ncbi:MAG: hypothetical protein LBT86_05370 [Deltaproteobacteria bacterium]|jgi:hypothetical protein|nr:hypothetical protein [Deltaproteobacteria bacterium]